MAVEYTCNGSGLAIILNDIWLSSQSDLYRSSQPSPTVTYIRFHLTHQSFSSSKPRSVCGGTQGAWS